MSSSPAAAITVIVSSGDHDLDVEVDVIPN
jgi:hypothetical protein